METWEGLFPADGQKKHPCPLLPFFSIPRQLRNAELAISALEPVPREPA